MKVLLTVGANADAPGLRIEDMQTTELGANDRNRLLTLATKVDSDDPAVFQLSGGTTGTPKVIPRRHAEYWYNATASATWWNHDADSVLAVALPVVHNAALTTGMHAAHAVGATLLLATPPPEVILPLMAAHGATWTIAPPGLVLDYLAHPLFDDAVSDLDTWVCTAARVPRSLFDDLTERGVHVSQAFGMSEGLFLFTPRDAAAQIRATTVGAPLSSLDEVLVLDPSSDTPMAEGEVGELCVRGPYTVRGYLDAPDRNRSAFTPDGYYRSGDLVKLRRMGGDPVYSVEGRVKDLIDRGGEKINAEEVEKLIASHPTVAEAAVVAMPDIRLGERACVFVVLSDRSTTVTLPDICTYLDTRGLAKFKWPERLEIIDELPRTQIGKISKVTLRDMVRKTLRQRASNRLPWTGSLSSDYPAISP